MGLDMYLGSYHKANLNKTRFNVEETNELNNLDNEYEVFDKCPKPFKDIATEIKVVNQYYDMEKISRDYANGVPLNFGGGGHGKIYFGNYKENIHLEIPYEEIENGYLIDKEETNYVVEGDYEIAYWRKANQIRQWFVNHIEEFNENDNCGYYLVTKELLEELIADCKLVINDNSLAPDILPTSSGFFFGSTEYDEDYYEDLEITIKMLENVINETDWDNEVVVYTESW